MMKGRSCEQREDAKSDVDTPAATGIPEIWTLIFLRSFLSETYSSHPFPAARHLVAFQKVSDLARR